MGKMILLIKNFRGKIAFLKHILDLEPISQIHQENFEIILSITNHNPSYSLHSS